MTYYVVRKPGSIGEGSAVVTELTPEWEALAAFEDRGELQRYLLGQVSNRMTLAYQGRFERRVSRPVEQRTGHTVIVNGDVLHIPRYR